MADCSKQPTSQGSEDFATNSQVFKEVMTETSERTTTAATDGNTKLTLAELNKNYVNRVIGSFGDAGLEVTNGQQSVTDTVNGGRWMPLSTAYPVSVPANNPQDSSWIQVAFGSHNESSGRGDANCHKQYGEVADTIKIKSGLFESGASVVISDRDYSKAKIEDGVPNNIDMIDALNGNVAKIHLGSYERISALGATASGDETSIFQISDTYTETTFDLGFNSYSSTFLPKGNYVNGEFVVGVNRYQMPRNQSAEYAKAQFNLKRDYSDSRYASEMVSALKSGTVILGDSISHGAYQGALYDNGWANLFKRMVNAENSHSNNGSYGLIPLLSWNNAEDNNTVDLAQISFTNNPTSVFNIEGEQLLNALAFEITTTATVKSTLPTFQSIVRVWYVQHTGGGTLEVLVNGVSVATQPTSGPLDLAANITVPMTDNGLGSHTIEVRASSGTVTFSGFGYETSGNVVNNFAQSGRKLIDATPECLRVLCTSGNLVMALGHNDVGIVEGNPTNEALFTANINRIIENCLKYNTNVVVPDFCWFSEPSTYVRKELKRLAKETSGTYIDFPSLLTRDYRNMNEFSASFLLVDTMHYWHDASHPNELGGQWIAETISAAIGLGCNTKSEAMALHDFDMPLQLVGTDLVNRFDTYPNLSTFRRNGESYNYNLRLVRATGGGGVPIGVYSINTTGNLPIPEVGDGLTYGVATLNQDDGTDVSRFFVDQQGAIKIFVDTVYLGTQEFSFTRIR